MTAPEFGARRQSREMALQLLFQTEFRVEREAPKVESRTAPRAEVRSSSPVRPASRPTPVAGAVAKPAVNAETAAPKPTGLEPAAATTAIRRFTVDFQIEPEVGEYGSQLFLGVLEHLTAIDAMIQSHSAHWKVSRMGLVDLAVMRICVYELKFLDAPLNPKIAIDEAIEIAKKYGSTESSAFVNGILDQVARAN